MKKPEQQAKPRPLGLSDEDLLLWQHTTRTLRPLHNRGRRIAPVAFDEPRYEPHISPPQSAGKDGGPGGATPRQAPAVRTSKGFAKTPALAQFDTRKARKIRAGRIEIEARLDLHGMRQSEALSALRAFLFRSQARGLKWVMVITGKGTFARDSEPEAPVAGDWNAPQRGILRRNVPMWLSQPELRAVVVSFTAAAIHHGGEGALYVQLRSNKS